MDMLLMVERAVEGVLFLVLAGAMVRFVGSEIPAAIRRWENQKDTKPQHSDEPRPERISFVDGLSDEDGLQETVEEVLDWVVAAAPANAKSATACSCVRYDGGEDVGAALLMLVGAVFGLRGKTWGVLLAALSGVTFAGAWIVGIAPLSYLGVAAVGVLPVLAVARRLLGTDLRAATTVLLLVLALGAVGALLAGPGLDMLRGY